MSVIFSPTGHRNIADSYVTPARHFNLRKNECLYWLYIYIIVLMMEVLFVVHTCYFIYFIKMVQVSWIQLTLYFYFYILKKIMY